MTATITHIDYLEKMKRAGEISLSLQGEQCQIAELLNVGIKSIEYDDNPGLFTLLETIEGKMNNQFQQFNKLDECLPEASK